MKFSTKMRRCFTVQSKTNECEIFTLLLQDLNDMKNDFKQEQNSLFNDKFQYLQKLILIKQ